MQKGIKRTKKPTILHRPGQEKKCLGARGKGTWAGSNWGRCIQKWAGKIHTDKGTHTNTHTDKHTRTHTRWKCAGKIVKHEEDSEKSLRIFVCVFIYFLSFSFFSLWFRWNFNEAQQACKRVCVSVYVGTHTYAYM